MDSPQQTESLEIQKQRSALLAQKKDAELALEWFEGPGYARIHEAYQAILDRYEETLHHINISSGERDSAAWSVRVCREFLGLKDDFARRLKSANDKLAELEGGKVPDGNVWNRLFSFVR